MIKKILQPSNWKKTYYYLKKNGTKAAVYAALERLEKSENDTYCYEACSEETLKQQKEESKDGSIKFSILVPVYNTPENYFIEMVQSVLNQTYPNWELLLGDASPKDTLKNVAASFSDARIRYVKLDDNKGISGNTNAVLELAEGEFIGLLDHDDVLTPDALYEMYQTIIKARAKDIEPKMIYSDEDKGDGEMQEFYDMNKKPAFDQDYLWSNNYICHFTVLEASLMKALTFRPAFDGAQDYDLFLRAAREITKDENRNSQVLNISKVLYHWRCHRASTAENPQSKLYAYEAGKRALEEDLKMRGIDAVVTHSRHLGFYNITYKDIFHDRKEVAMVAGPVYKRGRVAGGARNAKDELLYGGLRKGFSGGHLHRASVWQKCYAADFTHAVFREDIMQDFLKLHDMKKWDDTKTLDAKQKDRLRMQWADYVYDREMIILYDPNMEQ